MNESIILSGIVLLWSALMFILGRNVYVYYKKHRWAEMIVFAAIMMTIAMLSGGMILFFVFAIGCSLGLPLPCVL